MHKTSKTVVSISVGTLQDYAMKDLSKKDYKVLLFLSDYLNSLDYTRIDVDQIAESLDMKKKQVKECINNLESELIIREGSSDHVKKGYKFLG